MSLEKLPSLWTDSPLTLNYVSNSVTIDKSKRFQFNSIYYRDNPNKPNKKMDQMLFPKQILHSFRKNIREASKPKQKDQKRYKKQRVQTLEENGINLTNQKIQAITRRLYQKPQALPQRRDFYGLRCNLHQKHLSDICNISSPLKSLSKSISSETIYITRSQRLDFGRPINFNPGPGYYQFDKQNQNKNKFDAFFSVQNGQLRRRGFEKNKMQMSTNDACFKNQ